MRASALKYRIMALVAGFIMAILLLMPLHAFLTVWASSLFGHYTAIRLWKETLLLVCIIGALYLVITDGKIRSQTLTRRLVWTILLYIAVNIIWGLVALHQHTLNLKALGYGWIIDLRFPIFFLITWAVALRLGRLRSQWQNLVLWPAIVVVVFGLLQAFVLPQNFLAHFGYGSQTIPPFETINHNHEYLRIASTLRGANPLGAYLLIPISLLAVVIAAGKRSWPYLTLLAACLVTLFFSFSRSAWIGALLSLSVIGLLQVQLKRYKLLLLGLSVGLVVVAAAAAISLRHNSRFQNLVLHTQTHSTIKATSNGSHTAALRAGVKDIADQPLGKGPGSAGPASVYNNHPARIAENYYIQVGQETGLVGLALFLLIVAGVGYLLWLRRDDPLALALLASLIGLSFINLLSHAWADDTLAYIWWGLAGIAMAPLLAESKSTKTNKQ